MSFDKAWQASGLDPHGKTPNTFYSTYREPVIDHDKIIAGQSFVFPMIFEWKVKKIWAD